MKLQYTLSALALATLVSGCQNMSADSMLNTGLQAFQAVTLSDADVKKMSDEACAQMDSEAKIAPASSKYSQRLKKIANNLGSDAGGTPVNYKVYLTNDVNAWAMANGCVRVYSGLMDLMNDNEVEGVLGHEMGHVALGHSKKAMQTAYATSIARDAAASSGNGAVAALSSSQLGALGEALVNAQFSQSQESDADDFSFDLMKKRGLRLEGLASAFDKLAKLGGGDSSMFDSHPGSADRAAHIRQRIAAGK
ncbi:MULTISPECIES: M48 family metallopeptidase [Pseudomonas]|uniref:metalloprotease LoiP n=1 Tax=Pseudomonas TaxID=286 RepID=UPI001C80F5F7|nr:MULTISPECIES: M48 family metallopeptidase [Pseudomonas]MDH0894828.1 M48 family metallopeptidase [Pseudomonas sp. GD03875]MDH1063974.1 M48 family metallopeptidase [Pseudomonas sp. GD03985]